MPPVAAPDRYRAGVIMLVAALTGAVVLGGLAVFQALLISGAPLGRFAWGGRHEVLPLRLRIGSVVSVALYAFFAVLMLQAADAVAVLPEGVVGVAVWALAGYFALGIALNAASRSRPERLVMTPVVVLLTVVCVVLALG
jgi:hypothetical protein